MEANLDIVSRELIKPSSPTPHHSKELKLSFLDQLVPFYFVPLLFFYNKKQPHSKKIVDPYKTSLHLKQSLSEALTKFYPLAGKLNPDLISVDCDDSGALFVEAKVDAPLSQAVQNAPYENYAQYLPFDPFGLDDKLLATYPKKDILLAVQITWFECGGNAIGVCISHKVADFASLVTFMNSWAAANRGESSKKSLLMKQPNFDIGRQLFPPPDFPVSLPLPANKGKIVLKLFLFNKEKLTELKEQATSKDPTRVEVVTSFLWKQFINVARARNHGANGKAMVRAAHAVNLRSRMSSLALSDDEFPFGNLVFVTSALFTFDHENQEDADYGDLVRLTSDAIRKVNEDFVRDSAVALLKSLDTNTKLEELLQPATTMSDWFFTSWCRFPTYEVDFGWGKPISIIHAGTPHVPGVVLMSSSSEEGIEAWIAMLEDEVALLSDEFLSLEANDIFQAN